MNSNSSKKIDVTQHASHQDSLSERTNQQWLAELTGQRGSAIQAQAHLDMARHLQKRALVYLYTRQSSVSLLNALTDEELNDFAQDFTQETMEKLIRDDYALLDKYSGRGKFLSWMTQVLRHDMASELRCSSWKMRLSQPSDDMLAHAPDTQPNPERAAMIGYLGDILIAALARLPERYRIAFLERIAEGHSAAEVGEILSLSANAVNVLAYRAKVKMREYLAEAGVTEEELGAFDWADTGEVERTDANIDQLGIFESLEDQEFECLENNDLLLADTFNEQQNVLESAFYKLVVAQSNITAKNKDEAPGQSRSKRGGL